MNVDCSPICFQCSIKPSNTLKKMGLSLLANYRPHSPHWLTGCIMYCRLCSICNIMEFLSIIQCTRHVMLPTNAFPDYVLVLVKMLSVIAKTRPIIQHLHWSSPLQWHPWCLAFQGMNDFFDGCREWFAFWCHSHPTHLQEATVWSRRHWQKFFSPV